MFSRKKWLVLPDVYFEYIAFRYRPFHKTLLRTSATGFWWGFMKRTVLYEMIYQLQLMFCDPLCLLRAWRKWTILGKAHIKKRFFSGRTTKGLPSQHQWLSGPCHFFFGGGSYNSLKHIFKFFWVKTDGF